MPSVPHCRALYDRQAEVEHELSFKKDDILYVDDTLPQGIFGSWMAWQLDESAQKMQRGQIPSKYVYGFPLSQTHVVYGLWGLGPFQGLMPFCGRSITCVPK